MLFYRTALDQISHTWFDWNLVNGFSLVRKTVWINSRLQKIFIACVQHILLPKKIVKIINWSQLRKDCQSPHHFFQRTQSSTHQGIFQLQSHSCLVKPCSFLQKSPVSDFSYGLIAILYMASFFVRKTAWINSRLQQFFIASSPWRNGKNQSLKPVG